jgi:hypothetical protein
MLNDYDKKVIAVAKEHARVGNFISYPQLEEYDGPQDKYVVYNGQGYIGFGTDLSIAWTPRFDIAALIVSRLKEHALDIDGKAELRSMNMAVLSLKAQIGRVSVSMNAGFPALRIKVDGELIEIIPESEFVVGIL